MYKLILAFAAAVCCLLPARAETWVKVKSPHFTVISNGNEKEARDVAAGFEQIHAVFTLALPGLRTDSGAETIVIATKDRNTFTNLQPNEKKQADHIGGEFMKGWEKDYVIVRLDFPDQTREIVYHEYIHKLLGLNFTRLPVWLDEGLAEFFANSQFHSGETLIGAPSQRSVMFQRQTLYPLQTILSVGPASPYYRDADKVQMFYAESWGLTHFLMFGDNMGAGQKMNTYLALLQKGADSQKAFAQAFGDPQEIEKQFSRYIQRYLLRAFRIDKPLNVDASKFSAEKMSAAETDARLGSFFTYTGTSMPPASGSRRRWPRILNPRWLTRTWAFFGLRRARTNKPRPNSIGR